jgi:hypothetical protein
MGEAGPRNRLLVSFPALWLLASLSYILTGCHDTRREWFYGSFADAKRDGAFDRYWLPNFLPDSANRIHVVGDLSPSRTWCSFDFKPSDSDRLLKNAKKVDVLDSSLRSIPDPEEQWWPSALEGNLDLGKIQKAGFQLYTIETPETSVTNTIWLIAVDLPNSHGFLFSRSKEK